MSLEMVEAGGWDRTFFHLSSLAMEPFCTAYQLVRYRLVAPLDPGLFENRANRTEEIATRILIGSGILLGAGCCLAAPVMALASIAALGLSGKLFRAIALAIQKDGYTHVRGNAPEKRVDPLNPQIKVMSWNVCGPAGGMALDHGGVATWPYRIDALVDKIKNENPDVLVLQEIYDTALAEELMHRLKGDYAHFFTHMGPIMWGNIGGLMVLSKCAIHTFSHTSFENNDWTLSRGFADLQVKARPEDEQPCLSVIGTHLIHGNGVEGEQKRVEQVAQIVNRVAQRVFRVPTVLTGDLNIERDQPEAQVLAPHLYHGYQGAEPTCTNRFSAQWNARLGAPDETIDYLSIFTNTLNRPPEEVLTDCHLVGDFSIQESDHRAISATIRLT